MDSTRLPALREGASLRAIPGDFQHLETVVIVDYPAKQARSFLRRHLGNSVDYRLVEARRGETVGRVRAVEIVPVSGEDRALIEGVRTLPDGTIAGPLAQEDEVRRGARLSTMSGRSPKGLDPRDKILLHVPVRSYLRFLPAVFRGGISAGMDSSSAPSIERTHTPWVGEEAPAPQSESQQDVERLRNFLLLFQHIVTTVVEQVEDMPSLTHPLWADQKFLTWIASWVSFTLDEAIPLHQQRELIRRAIRLYRNRGTKEGMEEMVRVLTSAPAVVKERQRPTPFVVGGSTLASGKTVSDRYLRGELGGYYLYDEGCTDTSFFVIELEARERFARRFSERAAFILDRISQVATNEKPAHTTFTILFEES
ncbi:MAG: phage tail protein [Myxococcota bacterium]|nr:phage tail protein [Myxococcota bacterium]